MPVENTTPLVEVTSLLREGIVSTNAPTVLVVDDSKSNQMILTAYLEADGFKVELAANGLEAVEQVRQKRPDVILMDINMPVMDGYEATRHIKNDIGDSFLPILFLTGQTDEKALARCVRSGGDDFLNKPVQQVILKAKLDALLRISDLYGMVRQQYHSLSSHKEEQEREFEVAERLFSNVVHSACLDELPNINYLHSAMSVFNGDLLLATELPGGALRVLVGDFTGHGLAASIGALPVAEIFNGMSAKGFAIGDLVQEINRKLRRLLPVGRFFCASVMDWIWEESRLSVWNGGLPEVLVASENGEIIHRLPSRNLPLGTVSTERVNTGVEEYEILPGQRVYAYSDGIIEAENPSGELYGQARLEACFDGAMPADSIYARIVNGAEAFCEDESQSDDLTLMELHCDPAVMVARAKDKQEEENTRPPMHWRFQLEFEADMLRSAEPIPLLTQMLLDYQGLRGHWSRIFTVLTELYTNALDHGILGLDSGMKDSAEGFSQYYTQREQRLANLEDGRLMIKLQHVAHGEGGRLTISFKDSGLGFDFNAAPIEVTSNLGLSGRGIPLMRSLCQSLNYHGKGNSVTAVIDWD